MTGPGLGSGPTLVDRRPDGLVIAVDGVDQFLTWRWLRDHAEDDASLDPSTLQRRVDTFSIDPEQSADVAASASGFVLRWSGGVTTEHHWPTLEAATQDSRTTDFSAGKTSVLRLGGDIETWATPPAEAPRIDLAAFLASDAALTAGLDLLHRYGYLVLDGDANRIDRDRLNEFVDRIGYVRHTIFGGIWELAVGLDRHADTAYTADELGPHTDGTYSHDAPGLQTFLCGQAADRGGESVLVDGFAIAAELATVDPEAVETLATVPVPGRYVEPGVDLRAWRPVLRGDHTGRLVQVSYNNYDRAPFLLPPHWEDRFYRAYGRFAELAGDPARRVEVSLSPGDLLIFDNWRVLHGRNAFTGPRHYLGAYLNHEDLESKRRVLSAPVSDG